MKVINTDKVMNSGKCMKQSLQSQASVVWTPKRQPKSSCRIYPRSLGETTSVFKRIKSKLLIINTVMRNKKKNIQYFLPQSFIVKYSTAVFLLFRT